MLTKRYARGLQSSILQLSILRLSAVTFPRSLGTDNIVTRHGLLFTPCPQLCVQIGTVTHLPLGHELPFVREVVACVLPDDSLAPEDAPDPTVADPHGHNRHDVGQDEVHNVVAGMR